MHVYNSTKGLHFSAFNLFSNLRMTVLHHFFTHPQYHLVTVFVHTVTDDDYCTVVKMFDILKYHFTRVLLRTD